MTVMAMALLLLGAVYAVAVRFIAVDLDSGDRSGAIIKENWADLADRMVPVDECIDPPDALRRADCKTTLIDQEGSAPHRVYHDYGVAGANAVEQSYADRNQFGTATDRWCVMAHAQNPIDAARWPVLLECWAVDPQDTLTVTLVGWGPSNPKPGFFRPFSTDVWQSYLYARAVAGNVQVRFDCIVRDGDGDIDDRVRPLADLAAEWHDAGAVVNACPTDRFAGGFDDAAELLTAVITVCDTSQGKTCENPAALQRFAATPH